MGKRRVPRIIVKFQVEESNKSLGAQLVLPIMLILLAPSLGTYHSILPTAAATPTPLPTPNVFVAENITGSSILPGAVVTFPVNVTNSPAINGFSIVLTYDTAVLNGTGFASVGNPPRVSRIDFSNNVLAPIGKTIVTLSDCVDSDGNCPSGGAGGVATISQLILGGLTSNSTSGLLFKISFVVKGGFSQIHIRSATLSNGSTDNPVPTPVIHDGLFSNIDCKGPCVPPLVSFTWSPTVVHQKDEVFFNASLSRPSSSALNITRYFWTWGETSGSGQGTVATLLCEGCPNPNGTPEEKNALPLNATVPHVFNVVCNCSVTLQVTESNGIKWAQTQVVNVINLIIDLKAEDFTGEPSQFVTPGTFVNLTATLLNAGTQPLNGSFTMVLEVSQAKKINVTIASIDFLNLKPTSRIRLNAIWNTTSYGPKVYRLDAIAPAVANETNTANNVKSFWIQLIPPFSAGLSPTLLETTGIGILVIIGGGITVSRVRRKRPTPDFLEPTS